MGLSPGTTLQGGKYTIEKRLRVGLTTVSYLAQCSDGSRWVIKVLDPQILMGLSDDERDRAKSLFRQEAVKLARCSGTPHIVKSEMPFDEGELSCLPVEYFGVDSLAQRPQPILKEETALDYIRQVGEALTVVHGQGLVRRDIRPSNIFLRIDGNRVDAVLSGFGLAVDCDTPLTRTRAMERKDGFSPLELYAPGREVREYSDVYSLAATLYALLTGMVPASAKDRHDDARKFVFPRGMNPEITEGVERAIILGMQLQPSDRPQSVTAWLSELTVKGKDVFKGRKKSIDWAKWSVIWAAIGVFATIGMWLWDGMKADPNLDVPAKSEPVKVQESPQSPKSEDL